MAPLIFGVEMAPASTPQWVRIALYWPFFISSCSAARIGLSRPLPLGIAIPYGALAKLWPTSLNCPLDFLTWYSATGESAKPSCARPVDTARLAPFWSGNGRMVTAGLPAFLHLPLWVWASVSSVVPFSTATVCPQRSLIELIVVPPCALV